MGLDRASILALAVAVGVAICVSVSPVASTINHGLGSDKSSGTAPMLSGPTYTNWVGWNGNHSLYLTNYTGYTFLTPVGNSSFAYQTVYNSTALAFNNMTGGAAGLSVANAASISVSTVGNNRSWYAYVGHYGWLLALDVTDAGEAVPEATYIGPPNDFVEWAQWEALQVNLVNAPSGSWTNPAIQYQWDTGVNTTTGNTGDSGSIGPDALYTAAAAAADFFDAADIASEGVLGLDLALPVVAAILDLLALSGQSSGGGCPSFSLGGVGGNLTLGQCAQIEPNPTTVPSSGITSIGGDAYYSQSTILYLHIGEGSNALPRLGSGPASLQLLSYPILWNNGGPGWPNYIGVGAEASLQYPIDPAVSIQGNVTYASGGPAAGASALLQASCPTGSGYPSANYYETTNATGGWHFFAAPGCSYTESASGAPGGPTLSSSQFSLPSLWAGTNHWVAPLKLGAEVTFQETGLASGTQWYVNLTGLPSLSSVGPTLSTGLANGTYPYTAAANPTYRGSAGSSGSVKVTGSALKQSVTFIALFKATFTETGLPSGTKWYVNVTGYSSLSATVSNITTLLQNGTYTYSVSAANSKDWASGGSFSVSGTAAFVTASFVAIQLLAGYEATPWENGWSHTFSFTVPSGVSHVLFLWTFNDDAAATVTLPTGLTSEKQFGNSTGVALGALAPGKYSASFSAGSGWVNTVTMAAYGISNDNEYSYQFADGSQVMSLTMSAGASVYLGVLMTGGIPITNASLTTITEKAWAPPSSPTNGTTDLIGLQSTNVLSFNTKAVLYGIAAAAIYYVG